MDEDGGSETFLAVSANATWVIFLRLEPDYSLLDSMDEDGASAFFLAVSDDSSHQDLSEYKCPCITVSDSQDTHGGSATPFQQSLSSMVLLLLAGRQCSISNVPYQMHCPAARLRLCY